MEKEKTEKEDTSKVKVPLKEYASGIFNDQIKILVKEMMTAKNIWLLFLIWCGLSALTSIAVVFTKNCDKPKLVIGETLMLQSRLFCRSDQVID